MKYGGEGLERLNGFDGGRRWEEIASVKEKGEGRALETGTKDENK